MVQKAYKIKAKEQLNATTYRFTIDCKDLAEESWCGRFINILCGEKTLRRPISISEIDKNAGTLTIVFEIRGEGTRWLAARSVGDTINILGPLGNGFFPETDKRGIFIGGGIGCPPMLGACQDYGKNAEAILGFRGKEQLILLEDFKKCCKSVDVTTNDGSFGTKGFVTDVLREKLADDKNCVVYACGPMPMLKGIAEMCKDFQVPCYVSLEQRMACGIGACLCCGQKIIDKDGVEHIRHVCKDGPVFNGEEVVF